VTPDQIISLVVGSICLVVGGVLAIRYIRSAQKRPAGLQIEDSDEEGPICG
jgi:hypothetical protein